ncbi:hypothetical protein H5P27_09615 [Pelagicoccus albus]|uniref:Uncharacterized protein n=2 Tax=Pelagicoccus albus TaxID=415222 RepID=A0A7X1E804_9BACT|nr:hypothetical protein [Pelagicoccus albus]MBC2606305.1 hypothetical protein [Pelagicoccus albus]
MTKKYFIATTGEKRPRGSDFVLPHRLEGGLNLVSTKNGKKIERFMTVFTGVDLTPQKILKKMIDSGLKIESVDQALEDCTRILEKAKESKIGYIYSTEDSEFAFRCEGKAK